MNRYFFDVQNDGNFYADTVGTELETVEAAGAEAVQALAELLEDTLPGTTAKHMTMRVRDGAGRASFKLDVVFMMERVRLD